MEVVNRIRVTGPLAPYAGGLADELARLGFTQSSARYQLGLAAHLSRWLDAGGLGTADLTARRWKRSWRHAGRLGIRGC